MIKKLTQKEVLVGIPEKNISRRNTDVNEVNNAELLYIHTHGVRKKEMREEMQSNIDGGLKYSQAHKLYLQEHGSPLFRVPPRPVLEPAIEDKKEIIGKQIGKASLAALNNNEALLDAELNKAGMLGMNAAKGWFENPKNGWPENSASTIKEKKSALPLVDTNQLRKSITYVVRDKE